MSISTLDAEIWTLIARWNALVPINQLPTELLIQILLNLIDQPALTKWRKDAPTITPSWVGATHVCHHWRAVALLHGPLWTSIDFAYGLKWLQEMASRAQDGELFVTTTGLNAGSPRYTAFAQALGLRKEKIVSISLNINSAAAWSHVFHVSTPAMQDPWMGLMGDLPSLHYLTIHSQSTTQNLLGSILMASTRLERFMLLNCAVSASSFSSTSENLAHLSLDGAFNHPSTRPASIKNVLSLLSQAPQLQSLSIKGYIRPDSVQEDGRLAMVLLQNLRECVIAEDIEPCFALLDHLELSNIANLSLSLSHRTLSELARRPAADSVDLIMQVGRRIGRHLLKVISACRTVTMETLSGYWLCRVIARHTHKDLIQLKFAPFPLILLPGLHPLALWMPIISSVIPVVCLTLSGYDGYTCLVNLSDPQLPPALAPLKKVVLRNMDPDAAVEAFISWMELRSAHPVASLELPIELDLPGQSKLLGELIVKMQA